MQSSTEFASHPRPPLPEAARAEPTRHEAWLDEACFLAALRQSVEGAPTALEERLARRTPDWSGRLDRLCERLAG